MDYSNPFKYLRNKDNINQSNNPGKFTTINNEDGTKSKLTIKNNIVSVITKKPRNEQEYSDYFLSPEQTNKLINNATSLKNRIIISLMAYCGLRRIEIQNLRIEDINFNEQMLNLTYTKGRKKRSVPISKALHSDLKILIKNRIKGYVFTPGTPGKKERHLSSVRINQILKETGEKANIKNPNPRLKYINPHLLRHTFGRTYLRNGGQIQILQKILGHSSITTTISIYGHPSIKDIQEDYERIMKEAYH